MPAKKPAKPKVATPAKTKPIKAERTDVFVSYSHADKEWLTRLQVHLKPLGRDHKVNIWDDTRLRGGDKWKPEIDKALAKAKVAILLVSADFLASDFIHNNELPPLLQASEKEGLIILSIIVGHSGAFYKSPIGQYQAINEPSLPLNTITKGQSEQVFSQLYNRVYSIFVEPPAEKFRRPVSQNPKTKEPNDKIYAPQVKESVTKKIGVGKSVSTALPRKTDSSQRNENTALLVKRNGEWAVVTVIKSELSTDLNLIIKSADLSHKAFLISLRQSDQLSSIGVLLPTGHSYTLSN